jgi:prepilin-type N-terminal cleavage/methylation domain-containing protein
MRKHEQGFSFLEMLMVMVILGFVLTAGSDMVVSLLRGYKQQSKVSETNIEGIISLELMRRDIESAGYGLPWVIPSGTTYQEAQNAPASAYNDSNANAPRALLSGFDGSGRAYLVVKAINLGSNDACTKWTTLLTSGATTTWDPSTENLSSTDRVIVLSPGATAANSRTLVGPGGSTITQLQMSSVSALADFNETRIVYGVAPADGTNPLRMPFNRADYYVSTTVALPGRCAPGTGVLVKSTVNQADGGSTTVPLFDCVADMQVVTYLDTNADGSWDTSSNGLAVAASATAAQTIRDQLKEVHVFILTHEGQLDTSYTHVTNPMLVGESAALGRNFNFSTSGITHWQNYRWKIYTLVIRPNNLR